MPWIELMRRHRRLAEIRMREDQERRYEEARQSASMAVRRG